MTNPYDNPLHPLAAYLNIKKPVSKEELNKQIKAARGPTTYPHPERLQSNIPFIAGTRLQELLDSRSSYICSWLKPKIERLGFKTDVLAIDFAIVNDETSMGGWNIRLVEFQAFASFLATGFFLHQGLLCLWPELGGLTPWDSVPNGNSWEDAIRSWMNPFKNAVVVEYDLYNQKSIFDIAAIAELLRAPLVEACALTLANDKKVMYSNKTIHHICNRVVMGDLPDSRLFNQIAKEALVTWHSHPQGYYAINKGLMPELAEAGFERCVYGDDWTSLGVPPGDLVAKQILGYAGNSVMLGPSLKDLQHLPRPNEWVVQPRFVPKVVSTAKDGAPVCAEIRMMINLENLDKPWTAMQVVRAYRDQTASASGMIGRHGEGFSVLYRPF